MKTDEIRSKYLNFFKKKNHKILPSDSLLPENDPTLLFTSAGMNQFKLQFMGKNITYPRVTTCQKCLRTGDLQQVGKTPYHHTFFEMLGNFSFGDYFKKEAIAWGWEFLTQILNINPDKLWVSVYKDDNEAYDIWQNDIGLPKERIVKLGAKDNFWPSNAIVDGPNGPCGPCSEIYVDRGLDKTCKNKNCQPGCSCRRFVEVWNLVFTQYKREGAIGKKGELSALPGKNIDTGMGLERIAQVMQDKKTNFEIDVFKPIIEAITKSVKKKVDEKTLNEIYTVADHIRAVVFAIGDGVIPSNEDRGYVIRKLIRRSIYILSQIKADNLNASDIVPVVAEVMKPAYPMIFKRKDNIAQIIAEEEKKFEDIIQILPSKKKDFEEACSDEKTAGTLAFEMHDTYGIPIDISLKWARDKFKDNFKADTFKKAFDDNMKKQKKRSRSKSALKSEIFAESMEHKLEGIQKTKFVGYKDLKVNTIILGLFKDNNKAQALKPKEEGYIILKQTPFYAEAGGQVADKGLISSKSATAEVIDVKALNGIYLHKVKVLEGTFKLKVKIKADVDADRRRAIAKNHTATHLLQAALREVLGSHVEQSGSYVDDKRLRFDFTHFKQVTPQELSKIEDIVNGFIQKNEPVATDVMSYDEAQKKNVLAFFKEKYAQKVRVVLVGDLSSELCGGTHIDASGSIGLFKIASESSIASGIRRIEAQTGLEALKYIKDKEIILDKIKAELKTGENNLIKSIKQVKDENKNLKSELNNLSKNKSQNLVDGLISKAKKVSGGSIIIAQVKADMQAMRTMSDIIRQKSKQAAVVLISKSDKKALVLVAVSANLLEKGLKANEIINDINSILGSRGGGKPNLAQAGGGNPKKIEEALKAADKYIADKLA
jgi:alanyl-tRNA synthetase